MSEKLAGINLREDDQVRYLAVRDLRHSARTIERQNGEEEPNTHELQKLWQEIKAVTTQILQETQDLEVAVWRSEALLRTDGLVGLAEGFGNLTQLVTEFWPDFYPLRENDDLESQLFPLIGLNGVNGNGSLVVALATLNLGAPGQEAFSYWDYQTLVAENSGDVDCRLKRWAVLSGFSHLDHLQQALLQSEQAYRALADFLDAECGLSNSPPNSAIFKSLGDLREFVGRLLQLAPQPIAEDSSISVDTSSPITASPLHSRQQALKQLSSIANYFRVNEPSSPVILLLDRAVTWGEMSLSDLLKELIEDQSSLAMAGKILGIQPQQEAN